MSKIKFLVIHCTATPKGRDVAKADIVAWHTNPKSKGGRGWSRVGYSDLIDIKGRLVNLQNYDQDQDIEDNEFTNGVRGFNKMSRHVVYAGGMDKKFKKPEDTRTEAQKEALLTYVKFMVLRHPKIIIVGHNQLAAKACPSFDVPSWLRENCFSDDNIYHG